MHYLICVLTSLALLQPSPTKVPHEKDETTLIRIKADPASFAGKEVILCGTIELSDYYNYSYRDHEEDVISFRFRDLGATTSIHGKEYAHIYAPRNAVWQIVTDYIAKPAEIDPTKDAIAVVRVRVRLNADVYARDKQWDMLEAVDIQFIKHDFSKWDEWIGDIVKMAQDKRDAEAKKKKLEAKAEADAIAKAEQAKEDALNELKWRDWKIGNKSIRAKYNGISSGVLKVVTKEGTIHKLPIDKLTADEQKWIKDKPWLPAKAGAKK